MTIGIDLDDTLIDTKETANKYLKEFIKDESLKDYHNLSKKEYNKFLNKYLYKIQKESTRSLTLVVFANMDSALLQ